jgi:hypothetical protein
MATLTVYGSFLQKALNKEIDWDTDTIKVALATSSYTPNQDTHDYWNDVSANEVSGTNYTAGGATLANKTMVYTSGTNTFALDADDVTWAASTITARYAIVYDASPGTDATRPLIGYVNFVTDQSSSAGNFTVQWNAGGLLTVAMA